MRGERRERREREREKFGEWERRERLFSVPRRRDGGVLA
jgi:hypothetical protein